MNEPLFQATDTPTEPAADATTTDMLPTDALPAILNVFHAAQDIIDRFCTENSRETIDQVFDNLTGVVKDVHDIYELSHESAQRLIAAVLLVGHIATPSMLDSEFNENDEDGDRGVYHACEVSQFDDLASLLRKELQLR